MDNNYTLKKKSDLSDVHRFNRLYQAVEQFEYSSELAKRVYHLGKPCFTDSVHTASLSITQNGQRSFNFNRSFFDKLGPNEMIFVIFHEALHYTFRHLFRRLDRLPALWNIACDLVVNNFLLEKVGFGDIMNPRFGNFLESAITFENLPVSPVSQRLSLTAEEVYELLLKNQKTVQKYSSKLHTCDDHDWSDDKVQNETKDGKMDDDPEEQTQSNNDHEVEGNGTIEDLVEQSQKIFREWIPNWGDTPLGELRAIGEQNKSIDVGWDSILSRRIVHVITRF